MDHMISAGLIPARAGNTESGAVLASTGGGSSPLARGTRQLRKEERAGEGLIPARAGNTPIRRLCCARHRAHPRSRGEHRRGTGPRFPKWGSSPLARGTLSSTVNVEARAGLIPARAGNTLRSSISTAIPRAHPRSRGEHHSRSLAVFLCKGSSPLARGTRRSVPSLATIRGLIPARAGNTRRSERP